MKRNKNKSVNSIGMREYMIQQDYKGQDRSSGRLTAVTAAKHEVGILGVEPSAQYRGRC
jgi:hypothetical protein